MASVIRPDNNLYVVQGDLEVTGNIVAGDGALDLSSTLRIDSINDVDLNDIPATYVDADAALNVQGGAWIGGNLYTAGTFVANGDIVTLGNAGGSLTLNGNISSDVLPSEDGVYAIGSETNQWRVIQTRGIRLNTNPLPINTTTWDNHGALSYVTSATPAAVTLDDGSNGQMKHIICTEAPASSVQITPTNALGFTSVTFNNVGDSITMIFTGGAWAITSNFRASVS